MKIKYVHYKLLLLKASLCQGMNLLSCTEEEFISNHRNIISENDLGIVRELIVANGIICRTNIATDGYARENVKKLQVEPVRKFEG